MSEPFFSIVTPVFNGERYLEETIDSVINQSIDDYEYIVVDNNSKDNSIEIVKKKIKYINKFISEKDEGMYDALNKGFSFCKGKYFYWLNSDDYLENKYALENLKKYLVKNPKISWLNGNTNFKFENKNISLKFFPYQYPRKIIKNGFAHNCGWGFIQQESTIFSKKLFYNVGGFDKKYKMAGDYFLWKKFSQTEKLYSINISIGV